MESKVETDVVLGDFAKFLTTPLPALLTHSEHDARNKAIELAREVMQQVPAYQDLLRSTMGAELPDISNVAQFQQLPLLTKTNYLRAYELPQLCRGGDLARCDFIAASSGSTGKPTFWPRTMRLEVSVATSFEQIFRDSFNAARHKTLAVVCFALGTWVGGMYTTACCRYLAQKGYPVTVITPGNNKTEIFRVVKELAPYFEQTVMLGYPPFLKDVIDSGVFQGLDWPAYRPKLVFAGEVFSEEWRDLMCTRIGSTSPHLDTASLYGTADAGVLGNETPLSIYIRRYLANRPDIARELFGESRLPTLVQYDPSSRYFEVHDHTLVLTADGGVPLVRYHIADKGGIIDYQQMLEFLARHGFDPLAELRQQGIADAIPLPFVYVFGRADFTVSYFGANVYPENIAVGLEQPDIQHHVTGKFVLEVIETAEGNKQLAITVELLPGSEADTALQQRIAQSITEQLLRLNSEFANYVPAEYQQPQIVLLPAGHPDYFPVGIKHRYTRKSAT